MKQQQEAIKGLEAQVWIKRGGIVGKDTSKPIRFKTIQKNTKLAEFVAEENAQLKPEEQERIPLLHN